MRQPVLNYQPATFLILRCKSEKQILIMKKPHENIIEKSLKKHVFAFASLVNIYQISDFDFHQTSKSVPQDNTAERDSNFAS